MSKYLSRTLLLCTLSLTLVLASGRIALAHGDHGHHWGHGDGAPEIDPGLAGSGLTLLVGGWLLIAERYRRR